MSNSDLDELDDQHWNIVLRHVDEDRPSPYRPMHFVRWNSTVVSTFIHLGNALTMPLSFTLWKAKVNNACEHCGIESFSPKWQSSSWLQGSLLASRRFSGSNTFCLYLCPSNFFPTVNHSNQKHCLTGVHQVRTDDVCYLEKVDLASRICWSSSIPSEDDSAQTDATKRDGVTREVTRKKNERTFPELAGVHGRWGDPSSI